MADTSRYAPGHAKFDPQSTASATEPLWRMRKQAQTADAVLRYHPEDLGGGVEIQFFYNGDFVYGRRWPTRELAVGEADEKREELACQLDVALVAQWFANWVIPDCPSRGGSSERKSAGDDTRAQGISSTRRRAILAFRGDGASVMVEAAGVEF